MNGFLIIDKAECMTSFDVIRDLRKIIGIRKMGHGGTLDRAATGVLVIGINRATKRLTDLLKAKKVYQAEIQLGAGSATYDREGPIEKFFEKTVSKVDLEQALKAFRGEILQKPPPFSAKKVQGRRASDIMRGGGQVDLKARLVMIYRLELDTFDAQQQSFAVTVECSGGTYVRSLAHDIGQKLGTGAYLAALRRIKVGDFALDQAVKLSEIHKDNWQKYLLAL